MTEVFLYIAFGLGFVAGLMLGIDIHESKSNDRW
jgi:hypothetical protein